MLLVLFDRLSFSIGSTMAEVTQAVIDGDRGDNVAGEAGWDG